MRMAAGLIVMCCLTAGLQARADEPSPAPAPDATAQDAATPARASAATGVPAATAAPKAPAESTAVKPGITVVADPTALTSEDKEWLSRGYKLEMKNGEKYFCRREAELGSRFERKTCNTAVALREQSQAAEDVTRRAQTDRPLSGN